MYASSLPERICCLNSVRLDYHLAKLSISYQLYSTVYHANNGNSAARIQAVLIMIKQGRIHGNPCRGRLGGEGAGWAGAVMSWAGAAMRWAGAVMS